MGLSKYTRCRCSIGAALYAGDMDVRDLGLLRACAAHSVIFFTFKLQFRSVWKVTLAVWSFANLGHPIYHPDRRYYYHYDYYRH